MIALVDGDIITYRIGFASEGTSEGIVRSRTDEFLSDMLMDLDVEDFEGYLTGKGNFREKIAVTAPYKGNRSSKKPEHYEFLRDYLIREWGFQLIEGEEADDAISIHHCSVVDGNTIICSTDKDFDQLPGWHYNFVRREKYYVTAEEGLRNFYCQLLTGDRVDNILGIRGVGPVKAARLLDGCRTEQDYYSKVKQAYVGSGEPIERVLENGQLLWLRRYPGQLWQPPSEELSGGPQEMKR